jgi:hypothetical protein
MGLGCNDSFYGTGVETQSLWTGLNDSLYHNLYEAVAVMGRAKLFIELGKTIAFMGLRWNKVVCEDCVCEDWVSVKTWLV